MLITGGGIVDGTGGGVRCSKYKSSLTVFQQSINGCKHLKNNTFTVVFNISTATINKTKFQIKKLYLYWIKNDDVYGRF